MIELRGAVGLLKFTSLQSLRVARIAELTAG